jgi:hypothetical protein
MPRATPVGSTVVGRTGMELWIGDAAQIKTKRVRKQKTDREDAPLLLRLLRVLWSYFRSENQITSETIG